MLKAALDSVNDIVSCCRNSFMPDCKRKTSSGRMAAVYHLQSHGMLLLLNFRCKLLHQASSPAGISLDPGTPTKPSYARSASLPAESHLVTCANPAKVSCKKHLECLAQLYSSCITGEDPGDARLTFLWALSLLVCCEGKVDEKRKLWGNYCVQKISTKIN